MTAGPSEITIVCDKQSNPEWVASDLIGQAEHDVLAQCILISKDKSFLNKVKLEIKYLSGEIKKIETLCRIDTKNELEYYKNGGILQYVLRNMI